jgi:hypothetical protein
MPPRQIRFQYRALLLTSVALAALTSGAAAKDLPATPEGAAKISNFFATYAGKDASTPPGLVVTPEGSDYHVAADVGALAASLKSAGYTYDSAVFNFKVFEQDDAAWRVELDNFPTYHVQIKTKEVTGEATVSASGVKSSTLVDTAIAWIRSGQTTAEKFILHETLPGLVLGSEGGPLQATLTSQAAADGSLTSGVQETVGPIAITVAVDPKAANPKANPDAKPFNISAQLGKSSVGLDLKGMQSRPLLALWAFVVAHPTRPELAAVEPEFKSLLTAAIAAQTTVGEDFGVEKLSVQTPQGTFNFDGAKLGFSVAAAGPASRYVQHIAASGLSLPPALVPAEYQDFIPTSFDLGVNVSGFDLTALATEAIADFHLAGEDPPISAEDNKKVFAKLRGAGPVVIDIPSSHVQAPQLDMTFEGQIRYAGPKPTGTITLHMRDFDKSVAALKGLGPETERKMVPVVAMAKGLAKTDPNGVLTWVGEIGADGMMKVNGLPMGKSPF